MNRYKLLHLPLEFPINMLLVEALTPGDCIVRWKISPLPEGFAVRTVFYDQARLCFTFVIEHESFPIVPLGQIAESLNLEIAPFIVSNNLSIEKAINWVKL